MHLEQLEDRELLDVTGLLSPVSPTWFEDFDDGVRHVNPGNLSIDGTTNQDDAVWADFDNSGQFDWIVHFNAKSVDRITSAAETADLLVGSGVEFQVLRGLGLVGQVVVRSSSASIDAVSSVLAANKHVSGYELDIAQQLQATADDSYAWALWGLENTGQTGGSADADIDAGAAWDISTGSSDIVVGVIDTGVDYSHSDLAANIWTNPGEIVGNGIDDDGNGFIDDIHGYDFYNNDGDPMDDRGHGTHVAGTIGAVGNNGVGVAGVNWTSSIMALKFLGANGSGYTSDAVRAVNYATMMRTMYDVNIRVTNNSWGGGGSSSALNTAIQAGNNAGILFVAAAGNSGTNNDVSPHYPSNYDLAGVISVAATDNNDNLAYFSNYGASTVHLAAPGVSIYSTVPGDNYSSYSGTSMATPHVTGVAALAWSVDPEASVAEIRNAILQNTDSLASLTGKVTTGGRLNSLGTLQSLGEEGPRLPFVTSLSTSPNSIVAGTATTLTAKGVTDSDGTVASVSFYSDTNGNGTFDDADQLLGTDTTIVDGKASIALQTAGLAPGTHVFFARALDNEAQWSTASSGVLVVVPPDDHGNDAATATVVEMGTTASGSIELGGDVDWFAFTAVAGVSYNFKTSLVSLEDSVLYLYDQDGLTELAYNDDIDLFDDNLASQLSWTAEAGGTYYLAVEAYGSSQTGDYTLELQNYADDHAGNAVAATAVAVGSTVQGSIEVGGDYDWFAFEATTSGKYVFETTLTDLDDSILYLYSSDGVTLIDYSDDIEAGNYASRITWTADVSGTYFLAVSAYEVSETGDYSLRSNLDEMDAISVHRAAGNAGNFIQDPNGNGYWDGEDRFFSFGYDNDTPIVGDWNGDGNDQIGVHRAVGDAGYFIQDYNDNGYWDGGDRFFIFGYASDTPIVGDWNGDGKDQIGVHRAVGDAGYFIQDYNGNGYWDGGDRFFGFGYGNDTPIVGDWNGDGNDQIGVHRAVGDAGYFIQDYNGNGYWDDGDRYFDFGYSSDTPIIGDWNGNGNDQIGVHRGVGDAGYFIQEYSGNGYWDAGDRFFDFGYASDTPLIGNWATAPPFLAATGSAAIEADLAALTADAIAPVVEVATSNWSLALSLTANRVKAPREMVEIDAFDWRLTPYERSAETVLGRQLGDSSDHDVEKRVALLDEFGEGSSERSDVQTRDRLYAGAQSWLPTRSATLADEADALGLLSTRVLDHDGIDRFFDSLDAMIDEATGGSA